ncbi:hypothetical protein CTDIVETGP_2098 [Clostridium tyrobutyricum DIVETGP]|uniref:Uncharacterized protein n=1 Tax=Clostridium tyrobutyricum DIVETGP TaxID=1408889 RepID=W6N5Y1_CLOTY|nr:hypothetical protein CTK_C26850 [Clostridium tyrobutyricum]CDL92028.1 hypothetical protein CTDIVETGP_2098 [Clostridium tyrobutyricum DIVETGP]
MQSSWTLENKIILLTNLLYPIGDLLLGDLLYIHFYDIINQ